MIHRHGHSLRNASSYLVCLLSLLVFACIITPSTSDSSSTLSHILSEPLSLQDVQLLNVYIRSHPTIFSLNEQNCTCPTEEELCQTPPVSFADPMVYLKAAAGVVLVCMSALCAGLTTGLMGLDSVSLKIVADTHPSKRQRFYAKRIIPIRERGNLLLVTLILTNVSVNSAFSIISADLTSGLIAFIVSSALIVLFGEIMPNAICTRHALTVGAYTIPFILVFMFLLYPLAYPISLVLDAILGQEMGNLFTSQGLKEFVRVHAENSLINPNATKIIGGALDYGVKTVESIMTPVDRMFSLEISTKLDTEIISNIWRSGHSRIPVFKGSVENTVGIIFAKDLILIDPNEALPLKTFFTFYGVECIRVFPDVRLDEMLSLFMEAKSHLAIVHEAVERQNLDPHYVVRGLVTLEDVIEEIIKREIVDETDRFFTNTSNDIVRSDRYNAFERHRKAGARLSPQQVIAVSLFLSRSLQLFQMLDEETLHTLIAKSVVVNYQPGPIAIYQKGEVCDSFSLILSGRLELTLGKENFTLELPSWSYLGLRALMESDFICDFSCRALQESVIVRISKKDFCEAVYKVFMEQENFFLPEDLEWIPQQFGHPRSMRVEVSVPLISEVKHSGKSPLLVPNTDIELEEEQIYDEPIDEKHIIPHINVSKESSSLEKRSSRNNLNRLSIDPRQRLNGQLSSYSSLVQATTPVSPTTDRSDGMVNYPTTAPTPSMQQFAEIESSAIDTSQREQNASE